MRTINLVENAPYGSEILIIYLPVGQLGILSGTSDSLPVVMQPPHPIEQIISYFVCDAIRSLTRDHGILFTNQFKVKK